MGEMIFELLGPLDCKEPVTFGSQATQLMFIVAIVSITKLIRGIFQLEPHVSTDPTHFGILFHMGPHFIDGVLLWLDTDVSKDTVLRIEELAKALKEEHMR